MPAVYEQSVASYYVRSKVRGSMGVYTRPEVIYGRAQAPRPVAAAYQELEPFMMVDPPQPWDSVTPVWSAFDGDDCYLNVSYVPYVMINVAMLGQC